MTRRPAPLLAFCVFLAGIVAWVVFGRGSADGVEGGVGVMRHAAPAGGGGSLPELAPASEGDAARTVEDSAEIRTEPEPPAAAPAEPTPTRLIRGRALLADGTPLVGFRVEARRTNGQPARGERTDEDGSFALPLSTGMEVDVHIDELQRVGLDPIGGPLSIAAPYEGLELRYDALLITLELPQSVLADLGAIDGFVTDVYGAVDAPFRSSSMLGGSPFDASRALTRLLPAGPGYAFKTPLRDGPALVALVPPGTPSGRVTARLAHEHPDLGAVHVRFPEGGVARPDNIHVRFLPVLDDGELPRWDSGVTIVEPTNEAMSPGLLPGRYEVRAILFDLPPLLHAEATASVTEIEVTPGGTAEVEVSLRLGGRIELRVDADASDAMPPIHLERLDATGEWKRVGLTYSVEDGFTYVSNVPLGVDLWTQSVFPPGPVRMRLVGEGWITVEEELEIVAGVQTPWTVSMQRER